MKMSTKPMISGIAVLLCCIISSQTVYGSSEVSFYAGTYSPEYGDLNDDFLGTINVLYGTKLKLKPDTIIGIAGESKVSSRLYLRAELVRFEASASDEISLVPLEEDSSTLYHCSVSTTPVIMSAIYQFGPELFISPYLGVGLGFFRTVARYTLSTGGNPTLSISQGDTPLGFQGLGGIKVGPKEKKTWFLIGEVKYVTATAHLLGTTLDWDGISLVVGLGRKF